MCGIAGLFDLTRKPIAVQDLKKMSDIIKHRGPDDSGISLLEENPERCLFTRDYNTISQTKPYYAGFAHRRLSIIDLSVNGVQPMPDKTNELWITYNGEIFNYRELRTELESCGRTFRTQTDTEVILQAYDEWGIHCLDTFNGMWAFAIWDTKSRRLFVVRDRFGIKPLYYTFKNGTFAFASEPKALLCLDQISHDPDNRAIADYLVHSRVDCFDWTFFSDIKRLEPGCYFDIPIDGQSLPEPKRWWNLAETLYTVSENGSEEQFLELFRSSVKLRLRSDVPIGTCLSGGLDSTAVVCVARPWLTSSNQKTYSAMYDSSFNEDESKYIDEVAKFTHLENYPVYPSAEDLLKHIEEFIRFQDEPFVSTSQFAQFKVFQTAKNNGTTVTLDGQGADEALAGYQYLHHVYVAGLLRSNRFGKALRELSAFRAVTGTSYRVSVPAVIGGLFTHRTMIRLANRYDPGRSISWIKPDIVNSASSINAPESPGSLDWLNKRLYELFTVSSLPALLRYEDRNSMACSVEARLPFLDHRLVSFMFSLPPEQKIRDGWTKHIMRKTLHGIIPESIRTRTDKIGFTTPEARWFRQDLLPFIRNTLNSETTKKRGFYDIPKLIYLVNRHASGKINASKTLWRALNCELWFRQFID
ncbi:MAG: asparagine synthase (glutamine-hydrolyzing) [Candidatus Latescibacteria bacterium]|nr:asparagine synthase (glutamine-hydrolyzing) [Candidatus Latescibacterota bacterium]